MDSEEERGGTKEPGNKEGFETPRDDKGRRECKAKFFQSRQSLPKNLS